MLGPQRASLVVIQCRDDVGAALVWCERSGPIGYAGARNRERSAMDKLEALGEREALCAS